jgi:methylase of polypeptide subunit release factors
MICLNSSVNSELLDALTEVVDNSDSYGWSEALRAPRISTNDGFLVLLKHPNSKSLLETLNREGSMDQWLLRGREWTTNILDPLHSSNLDPKVFALYVLREVLVERITKSLRAARLEVAIPSSGGLLAFLGGLSKCLVLDYAFSGETPDWQVISVIDAPKSAFDFWGAIDQADLRSRNHIKRILSTGHKLIWHRGILSHVDRRMDSDVFGPSIDTLVMAEIIHQQVVESDSFMPMTALEVGSGNGLLTAAIAVGCPQLDSLIAIDTNPNSVACTRRTVEASRAAHAITIAPGNIHYINGYFRPNLLKTKFDLVVCNPPYIPLHPSYLLAGNLSYFEAVGGTELLRELIRTFDEFVAPQGRLLLMTSSLCQDDLLNAVAGKYRLVYPLGEDGFEVLFDVEAVLDTPEWLNYLLEQGGLVGRDGLYYHTLHPIWISL